MDEAAARVHAGVAFHAEIPLVSFFRLVHFGITGFPGVLCGTGRADQRGVHDTSAPHHPSGTLQTAVDRVKKQLPQAVLLQQMPELQQRGGVGYVLLKKVDPHEFAHGIAVIDSVLHALIGQVKPALQQVHPQHDLNLNGRTATLPCGVVGDDQRHPFVPRDDVIHNFQKFLSLCFLFPAPVLHIAETFLFHLSYPLPLILSLFLLSGKLNQGFPNRSDVTGVQLTV